MAKNAKNAKNENTVEDLKAPLLAAVGAADLALATVNEILNTLRERAEVAGDRMDDRRAALTRLQEELPKRTEELRGRLSTEELRKAADEFLSDATTTYNSLVERLMGQPELREAADKVEGYVDQAVDKVEGYVDQAVELTQDALGNVSAQTKAVGERAAKLVGTLQGEAEAPAAKAPAKKAPAKKAAPAKAAVTKAAPAKKAPAKKVTQK
jgi:heparin binding hemagglutinin HbhA